MFLLILDPKQITVISYNFTFQYVSINTHFSLTEKDQLNLFFTFQYVSINTTYPSRTGSGVYFFTFQYVSINTDDGNRWLVSDLPLHSNMFLLIPSSPRYPADSFLPLHSNMFLLIHSSSLPPLLIISTLHSNMFLLIRKRLNIGRFDNRWFFLHNSSDSFLLHFLIDRK